VGVWQTVSFGLSITNPKLPGKVGGGYQPGTYTVPIFSTGKKYIMNKNLKMFTILFICVLSSCGFFCADFQRLYRTAYKDYTYAGVIDSLFVNTKDRNTPCIIVDFKVYDVLGYDLSKITIGDSVVKERGSLQLILYKKDVDSPLVLKPRCNGVEFD